MSFASVPVKINDLDHNGLGTRENEIITKQFRYVGIAATKDGQRIYAITADPSIKIFSNTALEAEYPIENGYLPSVITLPKSERLLYIGMSHGLIRIYPIPLVSDAYIDVPAHSSSIRRILVSDDDQYVVSIAESAYVLLFRQTNQLIQSISSHYDFSPSNFDRIDIDLAQKPVRPTKYFNYILVTKSEFDEQQRKIDEIKARIK